MRHDVSQTVETALQLPCNVVSDECLSYRRDWLHVNVTETLNMLASKIQSRFGPFNLEIYVCTWGIFCTFFTELYIARM